MKTTDVRKNKHNTLCMETMKCCDRKEGIRIYDMAGQRHQCAVFYFILLFILLYFTFSLLDITAI